MSTNTEGIFITFEGGEGAGKTTHIAFLAEALREQGYEVVCTRDPGDTAIGEQLRNIVLNPENEEMSDMCELFVYEAARAQLVNQNIKPSLEKGMVVLCDRFTDSTFAYQARGRGIDADIVRQVNEIVCQGIKPQRTILMVSPDTAEGLYRATKETGADRLEAEGVDFHSRVNAAFEELAQAEPDRVRMVYSAEKKSVTAKRVFCALADIFPWMNDLLANPEFFERLDGKRNHHERRL